MNQDLHKYLFEFWKHNFDNICEYCTHNIKCEGEKCPKYENYGKKGYLIHEDGTKTEEHFYCDMTCMDIAFGSCPMLENTPCSNCFENDNCGFCWNGKIPDNYNCL